MPDEIGDIEMSKVDIQKALVYGRVASSTGCGHIFSLS
jgi:hypothetical protein